MPTAGGLGAEGTPIRLRAEAALAKVRNQAVLWKWREMEVDLIRRCWSAFVDLMWRARMRQYHEAAHAEATAARENEINELHAANARIAQLAFAQAGKTPEEAADEIRVMLTPSKSMAGTPSTRPDGEEEEDKRVARLKEQLDRVLERDMKRRDEMVKQRAWLAMTSSALKAASSGAAPAAPISPGGLGGLFGLGGGGGPSKEEQQQQAEQSASKLKAAHGKIDKLTKLVEDLTAEVEELTADLITAKLGQAELANAGMTLQQEKRQLEKQVISGSAPMHLFSFSAHTHAHTLSDLFCFCAFVCA